MNAKSDRYLTRLLPYLVGYRVEHSKRNSISPPAHELFSTCQDKFLRCTYPHTYSNDKQARPICPRHQISELAAT